ncbi:anthranilate synthase component II [Arcanobacterium bovis]|uniref:Aminodeoxychorismate/anthranilate synthase component II n=1 Tax=Arcanobacterium bovis TaxID=2529275 RepID=A0A4Q9UZ75_9ACTO|nr:aminodeoxychorismate/anthranilate synthase component II [Arcanobacterium bovis]TBW21044.1 aminodeoxychorismate/anthranilate synthase component II [Arcanobacterium bovis]
MARILVVDNYDSFVYTIVDYLCQLGASVDVVRNDHVDLSTLTQYDGVLISPGPGAPADAGLSPTVIEKCAEHEISMLGVCLGHQALAEVFGGVVSHAPELMHGKTSEIVHHDSVIMDGLPNPLTVTRYHSLAVQPESLPSELITTAHVNGIIMALKHRTKPLFGVQFHPESVLTQSGLKMLQNWLESF